MSAIGKSGARSSGPIGWWVPGWSGGGGATGRSAAMLYQARGIRDSSRTNLVCPGSEGAMEHLLNREGRLTGARCRGSEPSARLRFGRNRRAAFGEGRGPATVAGWELWLSVPTFSAAAACGAGAL